MPKWRRCDTTGKKVSARKDSKSNGGMTMITLRESIHEFISKGLGGTSKSRVPVKNLLLGKEEAKASGDDKESYVLIRREEISRCLDLPLDDKEVLDGLQHAIKESVKSYTNSKATAIEAYKKFLKFLELKYKVGFSMEFPPVFSSEFDRQMFIVKELHEKGRGVEYLEDKLWVSSRTIAEDLANLQKKNRNSVLGQKVSIAGIGRKNRDVEFESTVHPLFLTPNITQVIAMMNGLRVMSGDKAYKDYALPLAGSIWKELSDYGRNRIFELIEELSLDREWYEQIRNLEGEELFRTEKECSSEMKEGNVLDFLKNRKKCSLTYTDGDGKECHLHDVQIIGLDHGQIIASKDDLEYRIMRTRISRCFLEGSLSTAHE